MIQKLEVVHYPRGPGTYTTESVDAPDWGRVVAELQTMEPFEKPILSLLRYADIPDADLMMVNGGNDIFHVQVADSEMNWFQAVDPSGSEEIVDVWTSDQGFSCERKYTWPLEVATEIVRHYFENAERHPSFKWE